MARHGVRQMVFSSSATVYGAAASMPIHEDAPIKPVNPYGRTKAMVEEILRDLCAAEPSWSVALLRYFNPAGADASGAIGEHPRGVACNLVPYITQVAAGSLQSVNVYGSDYPTPDGTGIRDYIHITDLALGHVKALEHVLRSTGAKAYNLGTGQGYSVREVIRAFERVSGRTIPYTLVDKRPGDVARCLADPTNAERELQWRAQRGINEMCADAWRWKTNNPSGYA
jgi:UDP-glucose 4-epimerase